MSKRDFGNIKCLLHFDYPYFNEPNDGLGDETGNIMFSKYNNAKLAGNVIPYAVNAEPKFGYRCLSLPDATSYIQNSIEFEPDSNDNLFRLNSSRDYEFECFAKSKVSTNDDDENIIFSLWSRDLNNNSNFLPELVFSFSVHSSLLNLDDAERAFDIENYDTIIHIYSEAWGVDETFTRSTGPLHWNEDDENAYNAAQSAYDALPFVDKWSHVLLRISGNKATVFIDSVKFGECELPSNIYLNTSFINLGGFSDSGYIDEFVFRHEAGTDTPIIPTKPYSATLEVDNVGGYGDGKDGIVTVSDKNVQINSYGIISAISDTRTLAVKSWTYSNSNYTQGLPEVGKEVMIHITAPKSTNSADYPLVGLYEFARIAEIDDTSIVLDRDINSEFTLDASLLNTYYVQVITVPNYFSLQIDAGKNVNPYTWSKTKGGGIVAFRCKSTCNVYGSIITHGKGATRYDLHQMNHSKLIDRFLCAKGGGIFITCGGSFYCSDEARLGASWSGEGDDNGNGAAGYGGNGGNASYTSSDPNTAYGGNGGVGGGGGGSSVHAKTSKVDGGNAGSNGTGNTSDASLSASSGGGCGGKGGNTKSTSNSYCIGGSGGGGQGGSGGRAGTGATSAKNGAAGTINGGSPSTNYCSGGGGGPGGNGGDCSCSDGSHSGGFAGACLVIIANHLHAEPQNISTGGGVGASTSTTSQGCYPSAGGGGTGFCYIAAKRQV